jgi:hypothetical protein
MSDIKSLVEKELGQPLKYFYDTLTAMLMESNKKPSQDEMKEWTRYKRIIYGLILRASNGDLKVVKYINDTLEEPYHDIDAYKEIIFKDLELNSVDFNRGNLSKEIIEDFIHMVGNRWIINTALKSLHINRDNKSKWLSKGKKIEARTDLTIEEKKRSQYYAFLMAVNAAEWLTKRVYMSLAKRKDPQKFPYYFLDRMEGFEFDDRERGGGNQVSFAELMIKMSKTGETPKDKSAEK